MKLTQTQLNQAYDDVTNNHREPVQTIVRLGGDKEDYKKLHIMMKGY